MSDALYRQLVVTCQTCGWKIQTERDCVTDAVVFHLQVEDHQDHSIVWGVEYASDEGTLPKLPFISTDAVLLSRAYQKGYRHGRADMRVAVNVAVANIMG